VPYNNIISRADVDAFIPEDVATEVLQAAVQQSAALSLFPSVPMSSKTRRMPVLSALPVAYFVNGDTGLKQTTEMAWGGKYLEAEEIACIVPVPEAVLDDADFDLWGQVQPRLAEAVGQALDAAIFVGTNKPATWPQAVIPAAIAAGNTYERGTNAAAAAASPLTSRGCSPSSSRRLRGRRLRREGHVQGAAAQRARRQRRAALRGQPGHDLRRADPYTNLAPGWLAAAAPTRRSRATSRRASSASAKT
jgi:hypothetical protein